MKRVILILLVLALLFSLCACGGGNEDVLGRYECVGADWGDFAVDPDGEWIQLDNSGKGSLYMGLELQMEWKLDGEKLTVQTKGLEDTYEGTLDDGVIVLDFGGTVYTFAKEGINVPAEESEPVAASPVGENSDMMGWYRCIGSESGGVEMDPAGEWIEIESDTRGVVCIADQEYPFDWSFDGDVMNINEDAGVAYTASVENGVITLDTGVVYFFEKVDSDAAAIEDEDLVAQDYWNGDWYGWWKIDSGYGSYSDMDDGSYWYDCCATITVEEDGIGDIVLWDEDGSRDNPLAAVDICLGYGTTDYGCLTSGSGMFSDCSIEAADWIIDPGASDVSDYDHMICIDGEYVSPTNEEDSFYYLIYLRPWGMEWDDVEEENLPYYYSGWYLPCIEAGSEMPDAIDAD